MGSRYRFQTNRPDALPCKVYPMTQDEDKSLLKFLQEQEAKGYIRPSISPYASPFFFIQKKDGKLRPVQDYRCINDITISNQYPLPLITDLLTDLSGAKIFTKLDVKDGYNNIRYQGRRRTQSSIQNQIRIMGATGHVFWTKEFTSYVPKYDELRSTGILLIIGTLGNRDPHLHGRHRHCYQHQPGRPHQSSIGRYSK
jgi:hypothetical protein